MKVVIFGLSITSAWGNGHATTFRSLVKALAQRGHCIVFVEKDVEWYRSHRDTPAPAFCQLFLYQDWRTAELDLVRECRDADAIVIGSYFPDTLLAVEALLQANCRPLLFYDIDTPVTLASLRVRGECEYLTASLVPHFDAYLSFSGGRVLKELEEKFGAQQAVAFYCSVDPELYGIVPPRQEFRADLSYLGTYAADRQAKLMSLLDQPARVLQSQGFLVAGAMYPDTTDWAMNVARLSHVVPADHASFYCSARFTLNLTRRDMVEAGYSPSVRLFEASACCATIVSDFWEGIDKFLSPGEEILIPRDGLEMIEILGNTSDAERTRIGQRARERILASHTSHHRAKQFEGIIGSIASRSGGRGADPGDLLRERS